MFDQLSFVRRLSQLGTICSVILFGRRVGEDEQGNRYYVMRAAKGRERRCVMYAREPEATLVPPEWYGWLHAMCDEPLPSEVKKRYVWQKPHQPNLSGTEAAPLPLGHPFYCKQAGAKGVVEEEGDPFWKPPGFIKE